MTKKTTTSTRLRAQFEAFDGHHEYIIADESQNPSATLEDEDTERQVALVLRCLMRLPPDQKAAFSAMHLNPDDTDPNPAEQAKRLGMDLEHFTTHYEAARQSLAASLRLALRLCTLPPRPAPIRTPQNPKH
jgi:DNA-directed RNA polymerase specialized sigma24 family protein